MAKPTPQVDPEELDAFLATAPESLRAWADAQRDALSTAPGLADLEDSDMLPPEEPKQAPAPLASKINKVLVALLAAAIMALIQAWGRPSAPTVAGTEPAAPASQSQVDPEQVAQLEAQAQANPTDPQPLRELANLHQQAQLWQQANEYRLRLLELVPEDFDALLAVGVYEFNTGNVDQAEQTWLKAVQVEPEKPEGHFNLGFVYLAKEPQQTAEAIAAWEQVIAVAPDSELAKTARTHIERVSQEEQ